MASLAKALVIELNKGPDNQKLLDPAPTALAGAGQGAGATRPAGAGQTCGMRSGRVYLLPGGTCGQHSTKDREELLVFLTGRGELLIDGHECLQVAQGKVAYIPPHTAHDVKNTGSEPLVYVYCVAPAAELKQ